MEFKYILVLLIEMDDSKWSILQFKYSELFPLLRIYKNCLVIRILTITQKIKRRMVYEYLQKRGALYNSWYKGELSFGWRCVLIQKEISSIFRGNSWTHVLVASVFYQHQLQNTSCLMTVCDIDDALQDGKSRLHESQMIILLFHIKTTAVVIRLSDSDFQCHKEGKP